MEYAYTLEEQVFREEYYKRCGFNNTVFSDLTYEMQPPKIRNEIRAICTVHPEFTDVLTNDNTIGDYISSHSDFFEHLSNAEGVKEYRMNKDYCLARNSYDEARETQVSGMNMKIQQMLTHAAELDCNDLMDKATDRDRQTVDIYSEVVADLNGVLGQVPKEKKEVLLGLRKNSIYTVGEHFGITMGSPSSEAFKRLENVFTSHEETGYSPFVTSKMRSIYPENGIYKDMDKDYLVQTMRENQVLSEVIRNLNKTSPMAAAESKYGEEILDNVKSDPNYREVLTDYKNKFKKHENSR